MKTTNIIFWVSTVLICLVMGGSGISGLMMGPHDPQMVNSPLHYPPYIMMFISAAKVLGTIAILVPGFLKLKEWAYAGFTFDLVGATYSMIAVGMPAKYWGIMPVFFILLAVSYIYHHKRLAAKQA